MREFAKIYFATNSTLSLNEMKSLIEANRFYTGEIKKKEDMTKADRD